MALRSEDTWTEFFSEAGIPQDVAAKYIHSFQQNRITTAVLSELDKNALTELDVHILGDRLAILKLARSLSSSPADLSSPIIPSMKDTSAKVKPPSVATEMTKPQFRKFRVDWDIYKKITGLSKINIIPHLYNCCSDSVQNSILNTMPQFLELPEDELLDIIESLVTKSANPSVHRLAFRSLQQHEHESIQEYEIRLRTAVVECAYNCPHCYHDLSEDNIKEQFINGLLNESLQTDILAKTTQLSALDSVINHAKVFESAIRDQAKLHDSSEIHAARMSGYRSQQKFTRRLTSSAHTPTATNSRSFLRRQPNSRCNGCGSPQHTSYQRSRLCPAWGQTCSGCGRLNHFVSVCQTSARISGVNLVAHVRYDRDQDCFRSVNHNVQEIPATVSSVDGPPPHNRTTINIFPDSGASICISNSKLLELLGIGGSLLRPCNKKIVTVGGSTLSCLGWIPISFNISGHSTTQPVYICDKVDRLYFSRTGCIDTKILPHTFPFPMTTAHSEYVSAISLPREDPPPMPCRMPFDPVPENIPKLASFIRDAFRLSTFNNSGLFPKMKTEPAKIHLTSDAKPYVRHTPIPVPHHWKAAVKQSLDRDVARGIITPVPIGTPVTWCAPMVITTKKDGSPRRTVDLQRLNSFSIRETHHVLPPFQLSAQIPPNTYKSVIDATDGYHGIPLHEDSQHLTTFITEWGRYRYLRLPQGFKASGDAYTHRFDRVIDGVERKLKVVDDTLLYDDSIKTHFYHVWDFLTILANNGIVANIDKFQFGKKTVEFGGLVITPTGVQPSPKILSAIENFPTPTNITDARSWFGLVNQISWAYAISSIMEPFRDLIKPNKKFFWDDNLDRLFRQSKKVIVDCVRSGVSLFDANKNTCLQTDWSRTGIGYLLLQQHCSCDDGKAPVCCKDGWKVILAGSRFTNSAEQGYSPTEGEALAISWSLQHSRLFTQGCPKLTISTDHKPLVGVFNNRELDSIDNPRLFRLKESTLGWSFKIIHSPGKWHIGPDALSRYPTISEVSELHESTSADNSRLGDSACLTACGLAEITKNTISLDTVREFGLKDPMYQNLIKQIHIGFPTSQNELQEEIRPYWPMRDSLSSADGIVFLDRRIVIPIKLRKTILEHLHIGHQGTSSMKLRAHQSVYWPGIHRSITQYRASCVDCLEHTQCQSSEPLIVNDPAEYPFEKICMDYCVIEGNHYLVTVDRFSGWPIIHHMENASTAQALVDVTREMCCTYGAPQEISSDGGPQFISERFQSFLSAWDVKHRLSSAGYPQSNGRAEVAVKSVKRILHDNIGPNGTLNSDKVALALLQFRNTPIRGVGLSPAQILLHRQLRDGIPTNPIYYQLHPEWILTAQKREELTSKLNTSQERRYNIGTKKLEHLDVGTNVVIQDKQGRRRWNKTGRIVECLPYRQYRIKVNGSGRITLQNRRFLRPYIHTYARPELLYPDVPVAPAEPLNESNTTVVNPLVLPGNIQTNPTLRRNDPVAAPSHSPEPATTVKHNTPRALKRLRPHNNPGLNEL